MTMMKTLAVLLAAVPSAFGHYHDGHPHHHHPPSIREHVAKLDVESVCEREVEFQCRPPEEQQQLMMADPFAQWLMTPERLAPPLMAGSDPFDPSNIASLLDQMVDSALTSPFMMMPPPPPSQPSTLFIIFETSDEEPQKKEEEQPSKEEQALDSMVAKLIHTAAPVPVVGGPADSSVHHELTHHIRLKGEEIMKQADVSDERRRLGRRLMEVSPEEAARMHHQHDRHHRDALFGCPRKHQCLEMLFQQQALSLECASSVNRLLQVHALEEAHHAQNSMTLYISMVYIYLVLCAALFVMVFRRKWGGVRERLMLKVRILQTVYSNPAIKAKIEDELGEDLGAVPPLAPHGLRMISHNSQDDHCRGRRRVYVAFFLVCAMMFMDSNGLLPPNWPIAVLGMCSILLVGRMICLCLCPEPEPVRECKCCCCGGSTSAVENGSVSAKQACCNCCKGTGVCSTKCKSCCKDGCCGKGCDCCGDDCTLMSKDDCKCCCCGGSTLDVVKGTVSDKQACCNCCKGTGVCSAKCKTCCKDGCCGKGCDCCGDSTCSKKRVVVTNSKVVVYEGIPVQVV